MLDFYLKRLKKENVNHKAVVRCALLNFFNLTSNSCV